MSEGQDEQGWEGVIIWSSYGIGFAGVDMEKRDWLIGVVESPFCHDISVYLLSVGCNVLMSCYLVENTKSCFALTSLLFCFHEVACLQHSSWTSKKKVANMICKCQDTFNCRDLCHSFGQDLHCEK